MRHLKYLMVIMVIILVAQLATASNIDSYIKAVNPTLSKADVAKVAKAIKYNCSIYKFDCMTFVHILAQESRFKVSAVNHKTHDYGIGQLNAKTINAYAFNKERLITDIDYSIGAAALVLNWFYKTYGAKEVDWYARYNCGTADLAIKSNIRAACLTYVKNIRSIASID